MHSGVWINDFFAVGLGVHSFRNIPLVLWPSLVHEGQLICKLLSLFFVFSPDSLCVAAEWHQLKNVSKSQIPCGAPENLHCEPNISSLLRRSLPTFRVIMDPIYVNYRRGKNHPVHQKSALYAARGLKYSVSPEIGIVIAVHLKSVSLLGQIFQRLWHQWLWGDEGV